MIKVEFIGLDKFRRKLRKFSKSQDRIMKRALNRARVAGQTMAVREIKGLSGYKIQYIRGQIKSFSGKDSATIIIHEKRPRNLVDGVVPSQRNYEYGRARDGRSSFKREGVKAKGWSERKRKVYHGSFIAAPNGNALVFKRDRNGGLHPVYGASINSIIHKDKKLQKRISQRMFEVFDRTYIHEFDRIMNK